MFLLQLILINAVLIFLFFLNIVLATQLMIVEMLPLNGTTSLKLTSFKKNSKQHEVKFRTRKM